MLNYCKEIIYFGRVAKLTAAGLGDCFALTALNETPVLPTFPAKSYVQRDFE
jgi:hypothetical protein